MCCGESGLVYPRSGLFGLGGVLFVRTRSRVLLLLFLLSSFLTSVIDDACSEWGVATASCAAVCVFAENVTDDGRNDGKMTPQ